MAPEIPAPRAGPCSLTHSLVVSTDATQPAPARLHSLASPAELHGHQRLRTEPDWVDEMDHIGLLSRELYACGMLLLTHKVLDDPHELRAEEVELQTRVDDQWHPCRANERMTTICRHARIWAQKHTLMTLLL